MNKYNFAVFIISYNRSNNIITLNMLKQRGYTGKYYIIIDDKDPQFNKYLKKYKDKILIYNKQKIHDQIDTANNFKEPQESDVYVRNALWNLAKELGLDYILVLDDDYDSLRIRYKEDNILKSAKCNFDDICKLYIEYLSKCPLTVKSICFCQGGDLIGGVESKLWKAKHLRKAMNAYFFRVDNPVNFVGDMNADVNTYVTESKKGSIFLTLPFININQLGTQSIKGGSTEMYTSMGTYLKTTYSLLFDPTIKISDMGITNRRIHHRVNDNNTYPKILNKKYKKGGVDFGV